MDDAPQRCWQQRLIEDPPSAELVEACHRLEGVGGDVGAGTLRATRLLLANPQVRRVYAVDDAPLRLLTGLQQIAEREGLLAIHGDFEALPLASETLDFVVLAA